MSRTPETNGSQSEKSEKREGIRLPRRENGLPKPILATGLIAVCLLSGWIGAAAGRPFVIARQMREDNARRERKIADIRMETQRLRKEVAALETEPGREREARRLGYVKQGEVRLLIPQAETPAPTNKPE